MIDKTAVSVDAWSFASPLTCRSAGCLTHWFTGFLLCVLVAPAQAGVAQAKVNGSTGRPSSSAASTSLSATSSSSSSTLLASRFRTSARANVNVRPRKQSVAIAVGSTVQGSSANLKARVGQAIRLELGIGAASDLVAAHDIYCTAAGDGSPEALLRLGWMYADGRGVSPSDTTAATLFDRAARFGDAAALELVRERFHRDREQLPKCLDDTRAIRGLDERPPSATEIESLWQLSRRQSPLRVGESAAIRRRTVRLIATEARRFLLDPRLVLAIVSAESGFDSEARSARSAMGLMQLVPDTAERFAVTDAFDPAQNLRGGMAYLRWLLSYFRGDVTLAVAAYNAGEGQINRHGGVPPFAETKAYLERVRLTYPFARHFYDPRASRIASWVVSPERANVDAILASDRTRGSTTLR